MPDGFDPGKAVGNMKMPMTGKKLQAALQRAGARCEPVAASISSAPEETAKSRTADARYAFMSGPLF